MELKHMSPKQAHALNALLTCGTLTDAAKHSEVGTRTLFRYLKDPAFIEAYRQARSEQVRQTMCQVQRIGAKAAKVLEQILDDAFTKPSARVMAARTVLDLSLRAIEIEDLAVRLDRLEAGLEQERHDEVA